MFQGHPITCTHWLIQRKCLKTEKNLQSKKIHGKVAPQLTHPGASTPALSVSEPSTVAFNVVLAWWGGGQWSREAWGRWEAGSRRGYGGCICSLSRL